MACGAETDAVLVDRICNLLSGAYFTVVKLPWNQR